MIEAASVSMCAASEINARDCASTPTMTSTAMNPMIRVGGTVSHRRSASPLTPCACPAWDLCPSCSRCCACSSGWSLPGAWFMSAIRCSLVTGSRSAVRFQVGVVVGARWAVGVGVHGGCGQPGYAVDELVFGLYGDRVRGNDVEAVRDQDLNFGAQAVPDPAQPYRADAGDAGGGQQALLGLVEQGGVDGV